MKALNIIVHKFTKNINLNIIDIFYIKVFSILTILNIPCILYINIKYNIEN